VKFRLTAKALADGLPGTVSEKREAMKMLVYTEKAETDGVGRAGAAVPIGEPKTAYYITHGYAVPAPSATAIVHLEWGSAPEHSTMTAPPVDGKIRKGGRE
jgi:hypothetical protein